MAGYPAAVDRATELQVKEAARVLRAHLRRVGEHVDIWGAVQDGASLRMCIQALAAAGRGLAVTRVVAIEARGFVLGGAVAVELGVGLITVRKSGGLSSEGKVCEGTAADWRGLRHQLWLRTADVVVGDRVLLVDDWIETGSQAVAVERLVTVAGGELVGISVVVDQLHDDAVRSALPPIYPILATDDLNFGPLPGKRRRDRGLRNARLCRCL